MQNAGRLARIVSAEGFLMCPEGAATYAVYKQSLASGRIGRAVLFNCATGLKYPLPPAHCTLDRRRQAVAQSVGVTGGDEDRP